MHQCLKEGFPRSRKTQNQISREQEIKFRRQLKTVPNVSAQPDIVTSITQPVKSNKREISFVLVHIGTSVMFAV